MLLRWIFIFLLLPCTAISPAPPSAQWQLVKTEANISIYRHDRSDGLVEIRAQMLAPTRYSTFLNLLEDSDNVPNWVDNVSRTRVLKQISASENIVHTHFNATWPVKDRDMVTYSRYFLADGAFILQINDAEHELPKQSKTIRITQLSAQWTLKKLTNNTTHIEYTAFANPGGKLPTWLVNQLAIDSALNTFKGLKRELKRVQATDQYADKHAELDR